MNASISRSARAGRPAAHDPGPAAGLVLVAAGAPLFGAQIWGIAPPAWRWDWPLAVLAVGSALLGAAVLGDRRMVGLAYPGAAVTAVGAILFVQNATGQWQTWAYSWALVAPSAVGGALWFHGRCAGRAPLRRLGRSMVEGGLLLFAALAAFFELVLNLSGALPRGAGTTGLALLLVFGGAYLVLRSRGPAEAAIW